MAQLVVRNLDDDVKIRLRERAARHERSLEAEVREILLAASLAEVPASRLGSRIAQRFAGLGFDGEIAELHGQDVQPAVFEP